MFPFSFTTRAALIPRRTFRTRSPSPQPAQPDPDSLLYSRDESLIGANINPEDFVPRPGDLPSPASRAPVGTDGDSDHSGSESESMAMSVGACCPRALVAHLQRTRQQTPPPNRIDDLPTRLLTPARRRIPVRRSASLDTPIRQTRQPNYGTFAAPARDCDNASQASITLSSRPFR